MTEKNVCPTPVGYFTMRCDREQINKYPAPCKSWTCPVCGPKKKRKFLFSIKCATNALMSKGYRFRGLTLTLGQNARNSDLGVYWHRFVMALKKAGYRFEYLWVKEFQENEKLHLHALITAFVPWNVIRYYWNLATKGTSFIVWIAQAQVRFSAAYMSKYMAKNLAEAPFRKGERRYGMSKGLRESWPKWHIINVENEGKYVFNYKPDSSMMIRRVKTELLELIKKRKAWKEDTGLIGNNKKNLHTRIRKKRMKHNRSGLTDSFTIRKERGHRKKRNKSNLVYYKIT
ncbi:MAG: hypothetical protein A4E28_00068 [Methanocella sp. PtaU1.Bin125]|nr:MAG: hypothetical protein A4E28_00068 [Methanocella sp. PtaU1.Bin125]